MVPHCHLHLTLGPSRRPPLLAFNSLPFLVSAHCCLFLVSRLWAAHCCRLFLIVAAFFSHPPKHVHAQKRTSEEVTSSWGLKSIGGMCFKLQTINLQAAALGLGSPIKWVCPPPQAPSANRQLAVQLPTIITHQHPPASSTNPPRYLPFQAATFLTY